MESRPPAQPAYIFRGHNSQIHSLAFSPSNDRLLSGDAEGWLVCWTIAYRRPLAVWKAHEESILGVSWWGADALISHGRDSKLYAWWLDREDESIMENALPVEGVGEEHRKPDLLLEMTLNTLNFCSFSAMRFIPQATEAIPLEWRTALLIAVPHTLDSEAIDIFHLPSERRIGTVPPLKTPNAGMAMAVSLLIKEGFMLLLAGYESGHTAVYSVPQPVLAQDRTSPEDPPKSLQDQWSLIYLSRPHSQPILSLKVYPDEGTFLTTAADAMIARHLVPSNISASHKDRYNKQDQSSIENPIRKYETHHNGQQGLSIRSDGRIFATAGWDGRGRVYSGKSGKEAAVLKWHREGCYSSAFAEIISRDTKHELSAESRRFILDDSITPRVEIPNSGDNTKPSEIAASQPQAGLVIVEDGIREIIEDEELITRQSDGPADVSTGSEPSTGENSTAWTTSKLYKGLSQNSKVSTPALARREDKAHNTHWLALGSKDGKVSLWDIF